MAALLSYHQLIFFLFCFHKFHFAIINIIKNQQQKKNNISQERKKVSHKYAVKRMKLLLLRRDSTFLYVFVLLVLQLTVSIPLVQCSTSNINLLNVCIVVVQRSKYNTWFSFVRFFVFLYYNAAHSNSGNSSTITNFFYAVHLQTNERETMTYTK